MAYEAKIILDSVGPNGARLTTFELEYPRIVHSELLTHRMFSRNSASSRAIPTEKLLGRIEEDPMLPVWWGKNQAGMAARESLEGDALDKAKRLWLEATMSGVRYARELGAVGLHKQVANRPAELGMFITVVCTATEWGNFFGLRDHAAAQPELAYVAHQAHRLYRESQPRELKSRQWHLPYVTGFDEEALLASDHGEDAMCCISIGRCAAVSYLNQDKRDPPADLARADKLAAAGHMSPFEHVAQAITEEEWVLYGTELGARWVDCAVPVGNLWGWRQYRKELKNEHNFSKIGAA
jgi:thymidylate synthase ThyX